MNCKNAQKKNGTMKGGSINHMTSIEKKNEYQKFMNSLNALLEKCDEEIEYYTDAFDGQEKDKEQYIKDIEFYQLKNAVIKSPIYENMEMICGRKTQQKIKKVTQKDFEPREVNGKTYKSKYVMCRCNSPILRVNWKRHVITPSHKKNLENIAIGKKCKRVDNDILDIDETRDLIKKSLYNKDNIIIEVHNDELDEGDSDADEEKPKEKKKTKKEKIKKEIKEMKIKALKQQKKKQEKELEELKELEKKEKQELEEIKRKVLSTIKIQRFVRKHLTRKRVKKIVIIQSVIRRFIVLKRVVKMKKIKKIVKKQEKKQKLKIVDNKYTCECGSVVGKKDKAKHFKTKKHCKFIECK